MELLNILAKVLVVLGALIWVAFKTIWDLAYLAWEIIRDYSPLFGKKFVRFFEGTRAFPKKRVEQTGSTSSMAEARVVFDNSWIQPVTAAAAIQKPIYLLPDRARNHAHGYQAKIKPASITSKAFSRISLAGMVVSAALLAFIFFPDFVFAVMPLKTEPIETAIDQSALGGKFADGSLYSTKALPEQNQYLPDGNWLVIPKIGVLTQINEATTPGHEEALRKGVWRVPDFADPTQGKNYPTILVAHKFGYIAWTDQFRRQNSFYNLQKLEVGDTFEVIWDHRRFEYEVYAGAEGQQITDYSADIVLYTCKYLNSPARIFRYARRVEY